MKNLLLFLFLAVFSMSSYAQGEQLKFSSDAGYKKYENEIVDSISWNGFVTLKKVRVSGPLSVKGSLQAEDTSLHSLEVFGSAKLERCSIENDVVIQGFLQAERCAFEKAISITSDSIILKECSVNSIQIHRNQDDTRPQTVEIHNTCIVGSIHFESGKGTVYVYGPSKISEDQVIGGSIQRK